MHAAYLYNFLTQQRRKKKDIKIEPVIKKHKFKSNEDLANNESLKREDVKLIR